MMRPAGNNFIKLRSWNVAACLIAVLAMFASAASACACSHHQIRVKAEEKPPCHGSSHAEPAAAVTEDAVDSKSLRSGCSCFVSTRAPAMTTKSESKKFSAAKIIASDEIPDGKILALVCALDGSAEFESAHINYSNILLSSGPSRAPPRL